MTYIIQTRTGLLKVGYTKVEGITRLKQCLADYRTQGIKVTDVSRDF